MISLIAFLNAYLLAFFFEYSLAYLPARVHECILSFACFSCLLTYKFAYSLASFDAYFLTCFLDIFHAYSLANFNICFHAYSPACFLVSLLTLSLANFLNCFLSCLFALLSS